MEKAATVSSTTIEMSNISPLRIAEVVLLLLVLIALPVYAIWKAKASTDVVLKGLALLNRPRFTGERLVQILGCFFMCVQGFIEHLLCFVRRDISDGAVKTLGVVPIDPFQRFPFKLAH